MVGYGSQIASIDLLMTQSSFTSTGNPLDVAIAGEGFLQVMDPDGNIYYTKAGMLDIDPATGALIDSNGNFVLGTSATDGKLDSTEPGSNKILIQVAPVQASVGKVETEISGKKLTITSTNQNKSANVSFTFTKTTELPDGKDVVAIMDGTSSAINIQINANSKFKTMADLQKAINNAITEANGGPHAGGDFIFSMQPDPFADGPLTGAQIIDTATADYDGGKIDLVAPGTDVSVDGSFLGGFKIVETGLRFSGEGDVSVEVTDSADPEGYNVTVTTAGGATYTGFISQERADISSGSGQVLLKNASGDANDTITLSYPNTTDIEANLNNNVTIGTATASQPSKELGWGKGTFTLTGGTEFTEQDVGNLTGISIGADGTIMGTSAAGLQVLGRIDLATFANSEGLMQSGNSYFTATSNSGDAKLAIAGENGTGGLRNSALEMSNVDLSQEFSDMITTQRGFQACSRLITVSDTMLEELINLKR